MKIKTIKWRLDYAANFDKELNNALADGYQLVRRDIVPGFRLDGGSYLHNMLYAELVLPDPPAEPAEPEIADLYKALAKLRDVCGNTSAEDCQKGNCPLYAWCSEYVGDKDPCEWDLPEVLDE